MRLTLTKTASLLALMALVVVAAACGGEEDRTAEDVPADAIALIGDTEIPRAEFDALMERAENSMKAQGRPFPKAGTPEYQDLRTRAVSFLVQRYRFRAEAEELGVEVTDDDVREYYEKNKQQFSQPASRNVRHILVKTKAKADDVYRQLQNGGNFAALARQHSTDTSTAKTGGKIPVTKGSTVPPFDKAAFDLETGEISRPVKTQFGWHIIKADADAKPEKPTPLDKVEKSIRQQLETEKQNEALQEWLKSLEEKYEGETVFAAGFEPPKTETGTGTTPDTTTKE